MQTLRPLSRIAVALTACALLASSLSVEPTPVYAQTQSKKKKVEKKPQPVPPKEQPAARQPFTVEESDAAVVLGIPNARAWGDSETEFARLLPQVREDGAGCDRRLDGLRG